MNFGFTDEQREIKDTARSLLSRRRAFEQARAGFQLALWEELRVLGWPGVAVGAEYGGGGLGIVELTILAEELGYALAAVPLPGDPSPGADIAAVLLAAELVGVCQRALDTTVAYVKERKQFDAPVGSFQAVSHRCAEMLLLTEGSRSAAYAGAWAADADPTGLPEAASLAKAAASEAGREVTAAAIQLHGGIGFTWEADLHWLYTRAQLDAGLLGSPRFHRARLAAIVAARRGANQLLEAR